MVERWGRRLPERFLIKELYKTFSDFGSMISDLGSISKSDYSVLEPRRWRSANFDRRLKKGVIENLKKLSGKGPGRVVLGVEQENAGAIGFLNVFW